MLLFRSAGCNRALPGACSAIADKVRLFASRLLLALFLLSHSYARRSCHGLVFGCLLDRDPCRPSLSWRKYWFDAITPLASEPMISRLRAATSLRPVSLLYSCSNCAYASLSLRFFPQVTGALPVPGLNCLEGLIHFGCKCQGMQNEHCFSIRMVIANRTKIFLQAVPRIEIPHLSS